LYALLESNPPKPGLLRVEPGEGGAIQLEVWELDSEKFGAFIEKVPVPLTIGTIELEDGESVKGFLCEAYVIPKARDITEYGGWVAYLESDDS
jgi:allophanate hydrolase